MFAKLFADSGLSLDRLRALVEVGAAGSIAKATEGDPIRQSQYSRQIKELEGFFQANLVERHGKGIRLTPHGRELARISRFFLLGLSNFQRGCLAEVQIFRIGASPTFSDHFLLPALAKSPTSQWGARYALEISSDSEIERRLHDLTLDFGIITAGAISRPLQLKQLGTWRLQLWVPRSLCRDQTQALQALQEHRLPLVLPTGEISLSDLVICRDSEPCLTCTSFLEARTALEKGGLAALLPDFLAPREKTGAFLHVRVPALDSREWHYHLAWNPRLLRLNPHAGRRRDLLIKTIEAQMRG